MQHTLIKNLKVWSLNSGRTWAGKEETHQLTSGRQHYSTLKLARLTLKNIQSAIELSSIALLVTEAQDSYL